MKKRFLNFFIVFTLFFNLFISVVPLVNANQVEMLTDNQLWGSLINASQGGRGPANSPAVERFGGSALGGQRSGGSRVPNATRGKTYSSINPSSVDINVLYDSYNEYSLNNNIESLFKIVPVNTVLSRSKSKIVDATLFHGITFLNGSVPIYGDNNEYKKHYLKFPTNNYQWAHIFYTHKPIGQFDLVEDQGRDKSVLFNYVRTYDSLAFQTEPFTIEIKKHPNPTLILGRGVGYGNGGDSSFSIDFIVFTDLRNITRSNLEVVLPGQIQPTRQEFISNYEKFFNVKYDKNVGQLVETNEFLQFKNSELITNNINGDFIINNGVIIEGDVITPGEPGDNELDLESKNLLQNILDSVKELPDKIATAIKPLIPTFVADASSNIWDFLATLVDGILGSLQFLIETFLSLIIPDSESMNLHKHKFDDLTLQFTDKFKFITEPIEDIKSVFSQPKSMFDLKFEIFDVVIYPLPDFFRPIIDKLKPVLNGFVIITTFIYIYKKFQPDEVI